MADETVTREWLVDGATVYKLDIPHDPRYENGQPCPENRLSFHVQQGRGVKREEAEQMARYIAHLLNSAPSDTEQRLRQMVESLATRIHGASHVGGERPISFADCQERVCVDARAALQPKAEQEKMKNEDND